MDARQGGPEYRRFRLSAQITAKIMAHIEARGLGADDLLFSYRAPDRPAARHRPAATQSPGMTDPNEKGAGTGTAP